jgi:hypothetical protein
MRQLHPLLRWFGRVNTVSTTQAFLQEDHQSSTVIYGTKVNEQAFSSTLTFIPNGWNLAFVLQNNTNAAASAGGTALQAGAGCEAGFFQGFTTNDKSTNFITALELDSQSGLTSGASYSYSSAQLYQSAESPCNPNDGQYGYFLTNKISTSPVPLKSPASAIGTTTGATYSATITYDGSNLTLNLYDVTAGGSCPGSSCFTNTWTGVQIPSIAGSTAPWLGLTTATNANSAYPLHINSWSYTVDTLIGTPTYTAWNANSTSNNLWFSTGHIGAATFPGFDGVLELFRR